MEANETIEQRLWDYIDGLAPEGERTVIEELIATNLAWKEKYQELLETQSWIQSMELEEPSMRFSKNVMEAIAREKIAPAAKTYINKRIIWGIIGFFLTILVTFLVYGISQINWNDAGDPGLPISLKEIDFSKIDISRVFNNTFVNIFMMVNVVLGLMLLDRYLSDRRREWHKEA